MSNRRLVRRNKARPGQVRRASRVAPRTGTADLNALIAVARGNAPADLLLANGRVVNTFTGEIEEANVAVAQGKIAGVGAYTRAKEVVDLAGKYLTSGLIDGYFHLESSYLHVGQFARAVVPKGTLARVTDLHEIANVSGLDGIRQVLRDARRLPLDLFLVAPSCVPATGLETFGAKLGRRDLLRLRRWKNVIGLGEFMEYPGVINGSPKALGKLEVFSDRASAVYHRGGWWQRRAKLCSRCLRQHVGRLMPPCTPNPSP